MTYYFEEIEPTLFYVKWKNEKGVIFNIGMIETTYVITSIDCDNHQTEHETFTQAFNHVIKRWIEEL